MLDGLCCKNIYYRFSDRKTGEKQGELSIFVIENAHGAIIIAEIFEAVQEKNGRNTNPFSEFIL